MLVFGFKPFRCCHHLLVAQHLPPGRHCEVPPNHRPRCTIGAQGSLRSVGGTHAAKGPTWRQKCAGCQWLPVGDAKCCTESTNKWTKGGLVTGRPPPNCPIVLPQGPRGCVGPSRWLAGSYAPWVVRGVVKSAFCNIWQQFWDDFRLRRRVCVKC
jgi:hypothetical protein